MAETTSITQRPAWQALRLVGHDVVPEVHVVLDRMSDFAWRVHTPGAHPQRRQPNNRCCIGLLENSWRKASQLALPRLHVIMLHQPGN